MRTAKGNRGFTLLEAIIAVAVVVFGVVGALALVRFALSSVRSSRSGIVATAIAEEGLELVRAMRDDNWIAGGEWDGAIQGCGGDTTYTIHRFPDVQRFCQADSLDSADAVLYRTPEGRFTHYSSGNTPTVFRRLVTAASPSDNELQISVRVRWREGRRTLETEAEDHLWDWR